jgi:hypothetical protein
MRMQIITALPFIVATLLGCGQAIDVGSNPRKPTGQCTSQRDEPRALNEFNDFPDFSPIAVVVVGDAAYVSGVSYPGRKFDQNVDDPGRLLKFPLNGAAPVEVWRGRAVSGPLKSYENQIAFMEAAPKDARAVKNYTGLHLYDAAFGRATDVPNLEDRNFVSEFELGLEGLIFSAGTSMSGANANLPTNSSFSLARFQPGDQASTKIFALPGEEAPGLFKRGNHVLASFAADNSASGLDEPTGDYPFDYAAFEITTSGLRLEQRLNRELFVLPVKGNLIGSDTSFYYLASSYTTTEGWLVARVPRRGADVTDSRAKVTLSGAFKQPRVSDENIYWTPNGNRSLIHQAFVDTTDSTKHTLRDMEIAFDARRQIADFSLSTRHVVWLSTDNPYPANSWLMIGPRPKPIMSLGTSP